jgi:hypothetical protein
MILVSVETALAAPVMTPFNPAVNGFRFPNTFVNSLAPALDFHTEGLCGGMTYAVLDYYNAHWPAPDQDYRPANGTALQEYLYARQIDSIAQDLDKWTEGFSRGGADKGALFSLGLETAPGSRIAELRSFLDRGVPVPLGLQTAQGWSANHQVLAIGYDLGRYEGDLGANQGDFRIFLCDPNFPGKTMRLAPDVGAQIWIERDENDAVVRGMGWQSYFVATNYRAAKPPHILNPAYPADGKIHQLLLTFQTGAHDLRGDDDNVDLTVNLTDGTSQFFPNINLSAHWLANYEETAAVDLTAPVRADLIRYMVLSATFGDGRDAGSWDILSVRVRGKGGGSLDLPRLAEGGSHRFTVAAPDFSLPNLR